MENAVNRIFIIGLGALAFASAARDAQALSEQQERLLTNEPIRLQQVNGLANRTGDVLTIRAANGKTVSWRNEKQCDDDGQPFSYQHCIRYVYVDHLAKSHAFIILGLTYEGYGYDWVDDTTGTLTHLPDEPHPSPSANRIAVLGGSEAGGYFGVQVWGRQKGKLVMEWHHEPKEYALYDFKDWGDDETVLLSVTTWLDHRLTEGLPARAVRKDAWTFTGPLEASR